MKPPFFVEVLSRNGEVLQRQRVADLPIRLGRGYDNDVILDDAHSAASHAIVEADDNGQLVLRDLGSQNGVAWQGKRVASVTLNGNTVVRLGHTNLRVRAADFAVAPERTDTTMHAWEGAIPAVLGLALVLIFVLADSWLSDIEPFALVRYILALASGLTAALVWSGLWALFNRLFGSHARFGRHLFILGCGVAAAGLWRLLSNVLAYAWSAESLTGYSTLVLLAIGCGMLYFHLATIKPHHPRRFAAICSFLLLAGGSLMLMTNLQSTGRLSDQLYMSVLLPPQVRHRPDHSVDQFMADAAKLKADADAARSRSVKAAADADDDDQE